MKTLVVWDGITLRADRLTARRPANEAVGLVKAINVAIAKARLKALPQLVLKGSGIRVKVEDTDAKPEAGKARLRLVLDVEYSLNGAGRGEVEGLLRQVAEDAANRGGLTGETPAEVESWFAAVEST